MRTSYTDYNHHNSDRKFSICWCSDEKLSMSASKNFVNLRKFYLISFLHCESKKRSLQLFVTIMNVTVLQKETKEDVPKTSKFFMRNGLFFSIQNASDIFTRSSIYSTFNLGSFKIYIQKFSVGFQ